MWGSDEPGDLQLLQTERQTEERTGEALSRAAGGTVYAGLCRSHLLRREDSRLFESRLLSLTTKGKLLVLRFTSGEAAACQTFHTESTNEAPTSERLQLPAASCRAYL